MWPFLKFDMAVKCTVGVWWKELFWNFLRPFSIYIKLFFFQMISSIMNGKSVKSLFGGLQYNWTGKIGRINFLSFWEIIFSRQGEITSVTLSATCMCIHTIKTCFILLQFVPWSVIKSALCINIFSWTLHSEASHKKC